MLPRYLKLTPFDNSTEQGRSDERYRLAAITVIANVISRGIAMLVMVLTVSLTVPYLGAERFGVWMTIASFVGMLTFLDLGVGNALTNKVAQIASQNNPELLRNTISGGLGFLFLLGCVMGLALMLLASILPWQRLIKVADPALHDEVRNAVMLFAGLFGLYIFTNGIQRIFAGLQRAFEGHLVSAIGSIITLLALLVAVRQDAGIPVLLAITFGIQSVSSLLLFYFLLKRRLFWFASLVSNMRDESRNLLHVGGLFFLLQIGTMIGTGSDTLIISSQLGVIHVAAFAIVQKLFQFATQPMYMMNAPLWAAYADAHARDEKTFIRKTLNASLLHTGGYALVAVIILVIAGEYLVRIWTGNEIQISTSLLLAYGCWAILEALGNALAMFLNGCGIVRQQVINVIVFSVVSIPIKFFMINNYGLVSMIVGEVMTYVTLTLIFYGLVYRKALINVMR